MRWFRSLKRGQSTKAAPASLSLPPLSPTDEAGRIGLAQYSTEIQAGFQIGVDGELMHTKLIQELEDDGRIITLLPVDFLQRVVNRMKEDPNSTVSRRDESKEAVVAQFEAELAERRKCIEAYGFDSILQRALIDKYGLKSIASPLALRPHEEAYLSNRGSLQRYRAQRSFVGGSQGLSIPLGHGFRYRVGGYRGHMITSGEQLTQIDTGTLILTNQRLAFIGTKTTLTVPLAKVVNFEVYLDGFTIHREDKQSTETFSVDTPQMYWFYFDYLMSQAKTAPPTNSTSRSDKKDAAPTRYDLLAKIADLKAKGILTEEEFEAEKKRVLQGDQ